MVNEGDMLPDAEYEAQFPDDPALTEVPESTEGMQDPFSMPMNGVKDSMATDQINELMNMPQDLAA